MTEIFDLAPGSSRFVIESMPPTPEPSGWHRTSTIDYEYIVSGKIDLAMGDGSVVTLEKGDVNVQLGGVHQWWNRYEEPCVLVIVMVGVEDEEPAAGCSTRRLRHDAAPGTHTPCRTRPARGMQRRKGEDEMTSVMAGGVPFGTQIRLVAEDDPEGVGIIFAAEDGADREVTWRELDERSTQIAHVFVEHGLRVGDHLAVCLRNSPEHLMVSFAGWKVGATVVPMRWDLPEWERGRVLATIRPKVTVDAGTPSSSTPASRRPPLCSTRWCPRGGGASAARGRPGRPRSSSGRRGAVLPRGRGEHRRGGLRRHCPRRNWSWCRRRCTTRTALRRPGTSWPASASCCSNGSMRHGSSTWSNEYKITGFIARHPDAPTPGPGARHRGGATSPPSTGSSRGPRRSPCGWAAAGASWSAPSTSSSATARPRGTAWPAVAATSGWPIWAPWVALRGDRGEDPRPDGDELPPGEVGGSTCAPPRPGASYIGETSRRWPRPTRVRHGGRHGLVGRGGLPVHGRPPRGHDRHRGGQRLPGRGRSRP